MTMKLVAFTQVYENYAAHQGFDGSYHWKAKGGDEFVIAYYEYDEICQAVNNGVSIDVYLESLAIQALADKEILEDNEYYRVEFAGCDLVEEDEFLKYEEQELEYEGYISFVPYDLAIAEGRQCCPIAWAPKVKEIQLKLRQDHPYWQVHVVDRSASISKEEAQSFVDEVQKIRDEGNFEDVQYIDFDWRV